MATIGVIKEFDINNPDYVEEWFEIVECFFGANGINNARQKQQTLLSSIGHDGYHLLRSLSAPTPLSGKSYADTKQLLIDHFAPERNEIVERFKFYSRVRNDGESVAQFVSELRSLSRHCNFTLQLNDQLRDRIVCGINNKSIQTKLLRQGSDLTLDQAIKIATAVEAANKQSAEIGGRKEEDRNTNWVRDNNSKSKGRNASSSSSSSSSNRGQRGNENNSTSACWRCSSERHNQASCPFKTEECYKCRKTGHIARCCPDKKKNVPKKNANKNVNNVAESEDAEQDEDFRPIDKVEIFEINKSELQKEDPILISLGMDGKKVQMEMDTGAAITIASQKVLENELGKKLVLKPTTIRLKFHDGTLRKPKGVVQVEVNDGSQSLKLPIVVTDGEGPILMGRNWISRVDLNYWEIIRSYAKSRQMARVNKVSSTTPNAKLDKVIDMNEEVFRNELGRLKDFEVNLKMKEGVKPKFYRARPIPYALKPAVENEIERLLSQGIFEEVQHSEWAAPTVNVKKDDGSVRVCGDFKLTANQATEYQEYPVPKTEDLFATLNGGEKFTKLDLKQAYQQLVLSEDSRQVLTINTHRGLLRPTRMQFGLHSASGIFQRELETRLAPVPRTIVRVDDILITGKDDEEHLKNLNMVLEILKKNGLRLKKEKCSFMADEVVYLGFRISKEGVATVEEKVTPILKAPEPENSSQLRSFLGMLQYYHRHLPSLASKLEPLHSLLRKDVRWKWGTEQGKAFREAKKLLSSSALLVHFNPKLPMRVAVDASAYGVGAVLSHVMENGEERPVAYASRTLSSAEKNYAPTEREGLAVVFGVKKFHQYLYGHQFTVVTDHKPLLGILGEEKSISALSAARLQRWALLLSNYKYRLVYKSGKDHGNADGMSRLPIPHKPGEASNAENHVHMIALERAPVTAREVNLHTARDPLLSKVKSMIEQNWPAQEDLPEEITPFKNRKDELVVENEIVLWGGRIIIPAALRMKVLDELHIAHIGMSRMKRLARAYCWWPKMDEEIEKMVASCETCKNFAPNPTRVFLHPWEHATEAWQRVHLDHAGPFLGNTFLLLIDSYTKWADVYPVSSTSSKVTIEKLRTSFAIQGLPETIVTDNGTGFVSKEFEDFLKKNAIRHIKTAPYHPASNGQAERAVRTFKRGLEKLKWDSRETVGTQVNRFLFAYRNTPSTVTEKTPAEMIFKSKPKTRLDRLKPSLAEKFRKESEAAIKRHPMSIRSYAVGEKVLVRCYRGSDKWLKGIIVEKLGEVTYLVQLEEGSYCRRHADQIREDVYRANESLELRGQTSMTSQPSEMADQTNQSHESEAAEVATTNGREETQPNRELTETQSQVQENDLVRRSGRSRKSPAHLEDYQR